MPRTAEIIAVGSELLTGGVTNTNAAFLSRLLTAAGVEVLYHTTVDDDAVRLEKDVTIIGNRNHAEIWATEVWNARRAAVTNDQRAERLRKLHL